MKFNKLHKLTALALTAVLTISPLSMNQIVYAASSSQKTSTASTAKKTNNRGSYSNLVDSGSRKEVKKALVSAGISEDTVDAWLKDVKYYNDTIGNVSLVKKGFKSLGKKNPQYKEDSISKRWLKKNDMFIGYNCRITAYDLMKDYIKVKDSSSADASLLFMDLDALDYSPNKKFSKKETAVFKSLFSTVQTSYTSDVNKHLKKWQKSWKKKGLTISKKTKASLISVVMHSSFGKKENELFVGHTGVLVPTKDNKLLFIEKLSFELPYQVTKFDNRDQLNNYLMGMYDTEWNQNTAKPFIMENTNLMKGYHAINNTSGK